MPPAAGLNLAQLHKDAAMSIHEIFHPLVRHKIGLMREGTLDGV